MISGGSSSQYYLKSEAADMSVDEEVRVSLKRRRKTSKGERGRELDEDERIEAEANSKRQQKEVTKKQVEKKDRRNEEASKRKVNIRNSVGKVKSRLGKIMECISRKLIIWQKGPHSRFKRR